jgi:hypothetical protein
MSLRMTIKIRLAALGLGLVVANAPDAAATLKELAKPDIESARSGISQAAWRGGLDQWLEQNLFKSGAAPFSVEYDGKSLSEFLSGWKFAAAKRQLNPSQTQHVLTYTDPKSGLEVRCEAIVFQDYPAVEWVLKFKNTSGRETPILSNIQALDTRLTDDGNEFTLHHALGGASCPCHYYSASQSSSQCLSSRACFSAARFPKPRGVQNCPRRLNRF